MNFDKVIFDEVSNPQQSPSMNVQKKKVRFVKIDLCWYPLQTHLRTKHLVMQRRLIDYLTKRMQEKFHKNNCEVYLTQLLSICCFDHNYKTLNPKPQISLVIIS